MAFRAQAAWLTLGVWLCLGRTFAADSVPLLPEKNSCAAKPEAVALGSALWNGWGRDLDNSRYQPEPALRASDVEKLKLKWSFGYQNGTEFGQPTVVDGRVFVTSSAGRVYALDAKSGCSYWTFDLPAGSRSTVSIVELGQSKRAAIPKRVKRTLAHLDVLKAPAAAVFGDDHGTVYALDAQKGTLLWKNQIETHPLARISAAPVLGGDKLYIAMTATEETAAQTPGYACCTFRGSVAALDLVTGKIAWKSYTVLEEAKPTRKSSDGVQEYAPAGAAIEAAPTIDRKRNALYVGTNRSMTSVEQSLTDAVAAFDLTDGKLRWVKQLTRPGEVAESGFLSSPVLRNLASGNQVILAGQKSGVLYALDPDHGGAILWQTRIADGISKGVTGNGAALAAGGIAWGFAADYRNAYVALSGTLAQPVNNTGSITAIDLKTGIARWHAAALQPPCSSNEATCSHGGSQAVSLIPGTVFSGSLDGHLRAYSTIDGRVQWDADTAHVYQTVNGVAAHGGALDRGGATIVNGTVFINSGNALLAFSVDAQ